MTTDDLKAWLLLAGFKSEFSRYFYLRSGFKKVITIAILVDDAVEVRSLSKDRVFMNCTEAQQYIQKLIGDRP